MPQDLFTINRTVTTLNQSLSGAKINKVFQPSSEEVNLLLFNGKAFRLVISTSAKYARVSIVNSEKPNPEVAFNFCMLLRKYLTGAEIRSVEIFNNDRVIKISVINKNDLFDSEEYSLYAEIMGKYSNLFFTKNEVILGAIKQSAENLDGKRITLVGTKYTPPAKQDKISAYSLNAKEVFSSYVNGSLDSYIMKSFNDFSPVTAREIAYRINLLGEYDAKKAYEVFQNFIKEPTNPTVINDGIKKDFYPFNYLSIHGERSNFDDMTSAIENVYSSEENYCFLKTLKSGVYNAVTSYEKRVTKRLATLKERVLDCQNYNEYKKLGELITSQIYLIKKGATTAVLSDYYDGGEIKVQLDSTLSPQQNAQKYYKLYHKKKSTVEASNEQIKTAEDELNYILSVKFYLEQAESKQDIEEIKNELIQSQIIKSKQTSKNKKRPTQIKFNKYDVLGFSAILGKNNLQNDKLLSLADKNDIWLHVKDYRSSHLIIRADGKEIPEKIIEICAEICAYYSQGGKCDKLQVDYTKRRYVKKQGGKNLGGVTYENQSSILVIPNAHEELKAK